MHLYLTPILKLAGKSYKLRRRIFRYSVKPHRLDWDSSWILHVGFLFFRPDRMKVKWHRSSNVLVVYFNFHTDAPIVLACGKEVCCWDYKRLYGKEEFADHISGESSKCSFVRKLRMK
jgi:hypothetical protein